MSDQTSAPGFRSLEFDLPTALLTQVVETFDRMESGWLSPATTASVPNEQGVYQLFHGGRLVYIGKTDAQAGLRQRLSRHAWTIQSRHNLDVAEMSFKAVQVLVFSAMDLETALIAHYRSSGRNPAWNGSGFGSNDPGRNRDGTALRQDGFDATYPINVDLPLPRLGIADGVSAMSMLDTLSSALPYTLRYEKSPQALAALRSARVSGDHATARQVMVAVCASLEGGWQATRLPGRVILYREEIDHYPGGEVIARS